MELEEIVQIALKNIAVLKARILVKGELIDG